MGKNVLSIDLGASSGRAIIYTLDGEVLKEKEVHRFYNGAVEQDGTYYWDYIALFDNIKVGIKKALQYGKIESVGIDSWGVDFAHIGFDGEILSCPVHYRDERTKGIKEQLDKSVISFKDMYMASGLQQMDFNTIYQLCYMYQNKSEVMQKTDKILLMADLFNYMLTSLMFCEKTNASTTGLLEPNTSEWNYALAQKAGIEKRILPKTISAGEIYGYIKPQLYGELGIHQDERIAVVSVCSHDTASAVMAVPSSQESIYISSGTWSVFGTQQQKPIINTESYNLSMSNEKGFNDTSILLKNIMGLWIIQECKKAWDKDGLNLGFAEIVQKAKACKKSDYIIDVDDERFVMPKNMAQEVSEAILQKYNKKTTDVGESAMCVFYSLAQKYKTVFSKISSLVEKDFDRLYIIGGGANNVLLNQLTADALGVDVVACHGECSAVGNAIVQLMALGYIKDEKSAKGIVSKSSNTKIYTPINN